MPRLDEHVLIGLAIHKQRRDPTEYKRFLHGGPLPHPELEYICQECAAVFTATQPRRHCPNGHMVNEDLQGTTEVELANGVLYPSHPVMLMPAPQDMRRVTDPPTTQVFGSAVSPPGESGASSFDTAFHGFMSGLWVAASHAQGLAIVRDPQVRRRAVERYFTNNQLLEEKRTFFMHYCSQCAGSVPEAQEWLFGSAAAWALAAADTTINATLSRRAGSLPEEVRSRIANWAEQQPQWRLVISAEGTEDDGTTLTIVSERSSPRGTFVGERSSPRGNFEQQHMNEPPASAASQWQVALEHYTRTVEDQARIFVRPDDFADFARGFLDTLGALTCDADGEFERLIADDQLDLRYHEGQIVLFLEQHAMLEDVVDLLRQGFEALPHAAQSPAESTYFSYGMVFCRLLNRVEWQSEGLDRRLHVTQLRELTWTKLPFWFEADRQGNTWASLTLRQCPHPDAAEQTGRSDHYPSAMDTPEQRMAWDGYVMGLLVTAVTAPDVEIDLHAINYVEFLHYVTRRVTNSTAGAAILSNIQHVAESDLTRPGQRSNPAQAAYAVAFMQNNWPVQGWMRGMPGPAAPDTISYSSCWLRLYPRSRNEVPAAVLCWEAYPEGGTLPGYHVFLDGYLTAMQLHVIDEDDERVFSSGDGNRSFLFDILQRIRFGLLQEIYDECVSVYQSVEEDVIDHDLHFHDVGMSFFYLRNGISTPDIEEWHANLWQWSQVGRPEIWSTQFQPAWVRYAEQPSTPLLMSEPYPMIVEPVEEPATVAERIQQFEQEFLRGYLYEVGFHISEAVPSRFSDWEDGYEEPADAVAALLSDEPLFNELCDEICGFANRCQHLMPSVHLTAFENGRMFWRAAEGQDAGLWSTSVCQHGLLQALAAGRRTLLTTIFDEHTWAISMTSRPQLPLTVLTNDLGFNSFWDGYVSSLASVALCGNSDNDDSICPLFGTEPSPEIAAQAVASTGDFHTVLREAWYFYQDYQHYFAGRESEAGHDFNMTRNSHGVGFWDGDWDNLEDNAEGTPGATVLTDACEQYGNCQLEWRFDDPEAAERAVDTEYEDDPLNYDFLIIN